MSHRKLLGIIRDETFWRSLIPNLTVGNPTSRARTLDGSVVASVKQQLRDQGYFRIAAVFEPTEMTALEVGLTVLTQAGWPAPFIFLFDQPWIVYARLDGLLHDLLGPDYRPLAACWAWCLPKSDDAGGWAPHRDRTERTVRDSGDPDVITLWVSITEATPDNGCIYVVPAKFDPNYSGDLTQTSARSLQDVRALPTKVGSVLGWSHQLLHWGGRASDCATSPRMSLSAEFQRGEGRPLDAALDEAVPPFAERLALIGKQLIAYQHMQKPGEALLDIAEQLVKGTRYA